MFGILFALIVVAILANAFAGAVGWVADAEARRKAANDAARETWATNLVRGADGVFKRGPEPKNRRRVSVSRIVFYATLAGCLALLYGIFDGTGEYTQIRCLTALVWLGLPALGISGLVYLIVRLGRR